jgi:hypothetical protein
VFKVWEVVSTVSASQQHAGLGEQNARGPCVTLTCVRNNSPIYLSEGERANSARSGWHAASRPFPPALQR